MPETIIGTYPKRLSDWLKHETDPQLHRAAITLASGAGKVETGTVLAQITRGAASSAAKSGGNTGDGALTLDATTPVLAGAAVGVYTVRCVEAAADGGLFEVQNPAGVVIGSVSVGDTWAEGVQFVIADGATDFVVGDGFDVTVAAGSGEYVPCDLTRTDGGEVPVAINYQLRDATSAAKKTAAVIGYCEVVMAELIFHSSFDTLQKKRDAMAKLAERHIANRAVA